MSDLMFRKGARAMYQYLTYRAANHWHGDPVMEAQMKKERDLIFEWAEDAFVSVTEKEEKE